MVREGKFRTIEGRKSLKEEFYVGLQVQGYFLLYTCKRMRSLVQSRSHERFDLIPYPQEPSAAPHAFLKRGGFPVQRQQFLLPRFQGAIPFGERGNPAVLRVNTRVEGHDEFKPPHLNRPLPHPRPPPSQGLFLSAIAASLLHE